MKAAGILAILLTLALAAIRIAGHKSPAFQAIAHLWVGGLFGYWLRMRYESGKYLAMAVGLSLVELACFLMGVGR
jgi:hypothetical protein